MSEITSVEVQKKDKKRCNVYVDGRFYCGVSIEVAVKYRLKAGTVIEKSRLDEIQLENEKSRALDRAMTHLSASLKTKKQMRDFLSGKGYTDAVIDYVFERLEYYNFIDDEAYCRAYVQSIKGKGKRALEADLLKRGADKSAIEAVLDGYEEDDGVAFSVLQKYMRGKERGKGSLYKGLKYLMSKGYGYDTAKSAIERFGDTDEDYPN